MKCPCCYHDNMPVLKTATYRVVVERHRQCAGCGAVVVTQEVLERILETPQDDPQTIINEKKRADMVDLTDLAHLDT